MGRLGLPAFALGHVADRERRARAEVERLNAEVTGTLTRLQAAQEELVEAERMATVGRLSLKVAHEVRNPIAAIELNAELLGEMVHGRVSEDGTEATALVSAIRDQVVALDALTEEYLAFARFPRPQFEEDSVNDMVVALAEFVRPLASRQQVEVKVDTDPTVPPMEIDRTLLRQAVLNLVKNGLEALSQGGVLTLTTRHADVRPARGDVGRLQAAVEQRDRVRAVGERLHPHLESILLPHARAAAAEDVLITSSTSWFVIRSVVNRSNAVSSQMALAGAVADRSTSIWDWSRSARSVTSVSAIASAAKSPAAARARVPMSFIAGNAITSRG